MASQSNEKATSVDDVVMQLRERASWLESRSFATLHGTVERDSADFILRLWDFVQRARPIVEQDAMMMADLTRFAPLSPEDQTKHDSTEYPSEKWLADLSKFESA